MADLQYIREYIDDPINENESLIYHKHLFIELIKTVEENQKEIDRLEEDNYDLRIESGNI